MMRDVGTWSLRLLLAMVCLCWAHVMPVSQAAENDVRLEVQQLTNEASSDVHDQGSIYVPIGGNLDEAIELQMFINGQSIGEIEQQVLASLYSYFDQDQDGALEFNESQWLPDFSRLDQTLWNPLAVRRDESAAVKNFGSSQEFIDWVRQHDIQFVHVGFGRDVAWELLSQQLETEAQTLRNDGNTDEFRRVARLRYEQLDANGDGQLTADEVVRDLSYPSTSASQPVDRSRRSFTVIDRYKVELTLAEEVSTEFDGSTFQRVARSEAGEILVRYDRGTTQQNIEDATRSLHTLLKGVDTDGDSALSRVELEAKGARLLRAMVPLADRNRDESLSDDELRAWLDVWAQVAKAQIQISVQTQPVGRWELVDQDMNGRLSFGEWMKGLGADERANQTQTRITISHGRPRSLLGSSMLAGPSWFRAADANRDQHVERKEFVGPQRIFDQLDQNSDGLISVQELGQADRPD